MQYFNKDIINPLFSLLLIILISVNVSAQNKPNIVKRYLNTFVDDTTHISKPQLIVYPTVAYSPETSWEFGFSSLYVFYSKHDTANRLSEINGFTFYTLENQWGIWFDHAFYTHQNDWFVLGKLRLQSVPLLYYGIGANTSSNHLGLVDANQWQIRERLLRKVYKNLYLGLEADYLQLSNVDFHRHGNVDFDLPLGSQGSANLGFGTGMVYDNRHNILNVRHGLFSELAFLKYDNFWGSDYSFSSIISDSRIYRPINKRDVLAAQVFGQFTTGNAPFNHLALLGGESIMRGYYTGRYRDNNLIAAQVEYRFLPLPLKFTKRLGASVFVSTGTVYNKLQDFSLNKFVVAGGGGLRYLIFPKKDIFTRLDLAFTREGYGLYIFIGEAF